MKKFEKPMLEQEGTLLVKCGASWCEPCKQIQPTLDELSEEGYNIAEVDVTTEPELTKQFKVRGVPTMIVFKDGVEVNRFSGIQTKQKIIEQMQ